MALPVTVVYDVDAACPDTAAFVESVRKHGMDIVADDGAKTGLEVIARRSDDGYEGKLVAHYPRGPADARRVHAPTCEALIDTAAVGAVELLRTPRDDLPASSIDAAPSTPRRERPTDTVLAAGANGSILSGIAPNAMLAARVFLDGWLDGPRFVSPAIRIGGVWGWSSEDPAASHAKFQLTALAIDGCAAFGSPALTKVRWITLACARGEVGSIDVLASDVSPVTESVGYGDIGGVLRERFIVYPVAIELEVGLTTPIARRSVTIGTQPIHRFPAVTPSAGLGVSAFF